MISFRSIAIHLFITLFWSTLCYAQWDEKYLGNTHSRVHVRDGQVIVTGVNTYSAYNVLGNFTWIQGVSNTTDAARDPLGSIYANLFVAGNSMYRSTDLNSAIMTMSGGLRQVEFFNDTIGYFAGNGIRKTTDGTQSFTVLTLPPAAMGIVYDRLRLPAYDVVYASGNKTLIKSFDGGSSWQVDTFPEVIKGISFTSADTGYVVTEDGYFFKTYNAGNTWQQVHHESDRTYNTVFAITHDTIFIGGDDIYASFDGGQSWRRQLFDSVDVVDIEFYGNVGVAVNRSDNIWYTHNRGGGGTYANDASAGEVRLSPGLSVMCPGQYSFQFDLRNMGSDTLRDVYIAISIGDSVPQTDTLHWWGSLPPGEMVTDLPLGSFFLSNQDSNRLKLTTLLPNGVPDSNLNDLGPTVFPMFRLSGPYSVGPGGDYTTLAQAFYSLYQNMNCGDVSFNMLPGHHILNGARTFDVPSTSPSAQITVRSSTGNPNDVIISDSSYSSNWPVFIINAMRYLNFENINFRRYYPSGKIIVWQPGAGDITFTNCSFEIMFPNAGTHGFSPASASYVLLGSAVFDSCQFINGGGATVQVQDSCIVRNSHMLRSKFLINQAGYVDIGNNHFDKCHFLKVESNTKPINIHHNFLDSAYVYIYYPNNPNNDTVRIYNNYIRHNYYQPTIQLDGPTIAQIEYNTLVNDSIGPVIGLSGNPTHIYNNIMVQRDSGNIYQGSLIGLHADYNWMYSTNTLINDGGYPVSYGLPDEYNIGTWQTILQKDLNSHFQTIELPETGYLLPLSQINTPIDGTAKPIARIMDDIEGNPRDGLNPDPGAWELEWPATDVAVIDLSPDIFSCSGLEEFAVKLNNTGTNLIDSCLLAWSLNGQLMTPVMVTQIPLPNDTSQWIFLGDSLLSGGQTLDIAAWVDSTYGNLDGNKANDTISGTVTTVGMNGLYTIGGSNPDFQTIQTAIQALQTNGICDQVTFELASGTYVLNSPLTIPEITGATIYKPVIFTSANNDSSSVIIRGQPITLDGAKFITFDHIGFNTSLYWESSTSHINVTNCHFNFSASDILMVRTLSTSGSYTENRFENNYFIRTLIDWNGGAAIDLNNQFVNNQFIDHYVKITSQAGLVFENNTLLDTLSPIYTNSTYAIDLSGIYTHLNFERNRIFTENLSGVKIQASIYSTTSNLFDDLHHVAVYNNSIESQNGSTGLYIYTGEVINNTIRIRSTGSAITTLNRSIVKNNILVNTGLGNAAEYSIINSFETRADYNVYYGGQTLVSYNGHDYSSIYNHFIATGNDEHSIERMPVFAATTGYQITNDQSIEGMAIAYPQVDIDIEGNVRDTIHPDPGAYEFLTTPLSLDAGLGGSFTNLQLCQNTNSDVEVKLTNTGLTDIDSVRIKWQVNGVSQPSYNWQGLLLADSSITVTVGNYGFTSPTEYNIVFWIETVNGQPDGTPNDTMSYTGLTLPMNGDISVYGIGADFQNLKSAMEYLKSHGVCGPVSINIKPGTHSVDGTDFLNQYIKGVNATNTITFKSATNNAGDVLLQNVGLELKKLKHVSFKHLSMSSSGTGIGSLAIIDSCVNLRIDSCIFYIDGYSTQNTSYGISKSSGYCDSLYITNCTFNGGALRANNKLSNLWFENNVIIDPYDDGVYTLNCVNLYLSNNTIIQHNPRSGYIGKGFGINSFKGDLHVIKNDIAGSFQSGIIFSNSGGYNSVKLFNNVVNGDSSMIYGINFASGANFVEPDSIIYNTVAVTSTNSNAIAMRLNSTRPKVFKNNIMANLGGGVACEYSGQNGANFSNNILYTTGQYVYDYYDTLYDNLQDLQQVENTEYNSYIFDPEFVSANDLHFTSDSLLNKATPIARLPHDIQDSLRDILYPNPGAYEVIPQVANDSLTKDVEVISIDNDTLLIGSQSLTVSFTLHELVSPLNYFNYTGTVDSIVLGYSINDTLTGSELYSVPIHPGDSITYTFFTPFSIPKGRTYDIVAWAKVPTTYQDISSLNDTVKKQLFLPMAGTYTVWGANPDFKNIEDAMASLDIAGSTDSVTFNMRAGVDTIGPHYRFIGSNDNHRIIYRSESGDPSDVILRIGSVYEESNITFENVTIWPITSAAVIYNYIGMEFNYCNNIELYGCEIIGDFNRSRNGGISFVSSTNAKIVNCHFKNLNSGVSYTGYGAVWHGHQGIQVIRNCTFENSDYGVVIDGEWSAVDSLVIENCEMQVSNTGVLVLSEGNHGIFIKNNHIVNSSPSEGIKFSISGNISNTLIHSNYLENGSLKFFDLIAGYDLYNTYIANNFISNGIILNGDGSTKRFYNLRLYHNSVYNGLLLDGKMDIEMYNNAIAGGSSPGLYFDALASITGSNNSLFASGSAALAYKPNTAYHDITTLYNDYNDLQGIFFYADPLFISNSDLHIRPGSGLLNAGTSVTGLPVDIDGDIRNQQNPEVGADEYTTAPLFTDAQLLQLIVTDTPCINGQIAIKVFNNGTVPLTHATVILKVNGNVTDSIDLPNPLPPNDSSGILSLANVNFIGGQQYNLEAYLADHNSLDLYPYNDTLKKQYNFNYNLLQTPANTYCTDVLLGTDTGFVSYSWSTGETTDSIYISQSGVYSLTITDSYGCTVSDNQAVTVINGVSLDITTIPANCGMADGEISVAVVTGAVPFSFDWYSALSDSSRLVDAGTGQYLLTVEDFNGCTADSIITINNTCQDVWPGDANTDGRVDFVDFIYICIGNGESGSIRANASLNWIAQPSADWNTKLPPSDLKHLDTDGNGLIDLNDTMAVAQNYSSTHFKKEDLKQPQTNAPKVYLDIQETSVNNGDLVHVNLYGGESVLSFEELYGLVATLSLDNSLFEVHTGINTQGIWLGTQAEISNMQHLSFGNYTVGISRTVHGNQSGHGLLGSFVLKVPEDLGVNTPTSLTGQIYFTEVLAFDSAAQPIPVDWYGDSLIINARPVGISHDNIELMDLNIFPNPFVNSISVRLNQLSSGVVTVFDNLGKLTYEASFEQLQNIRILSAHWSPGSYTLKINTQNGCFVRRIMKIE